MSAARLCELRMGRAPLPPHVGRFKPAVRAWQTRALHRLLRPQWRGAKRVREAHLVLDVAAGMAAYLGSANLPPPTQN